MLDKLFEASKFLKPCLKHLLSSLGALTVGDVIESEGSKPATEIRHGGNPGEAMNLSSSSRSSSGGSGNTGFVSTALNSVMSRWSRRMGKQRQGVAGDSKGRTAVAGHDSNTPPFALLKLIETTEHNMHRVAVSWDITAVHLHMIASKNSDSRLRVFCTTSLAQLTTTALQHVKDGEGREPVAIRHFTTPLSLLPERLREYTPNQSKCSRSAVEVMWTHPL